MRAADLAADANFGDGSPWEISKIYWNTMPRSVIQEGIDKMKEIGSDFFGHPGINLIHRGYFVADKSNHWNDDCQQNP